MNEHKIPCPLCCHPVDIDQTVYEKGGIARCKKCGHGFRLKGKQKLEHEKSTIRLEIVK